MTTLLQRASSAPPDLLHRFVETPYRVTWKLPATSVIIETNYQDILHTFDRSEPNGRKTRPTIEIRAVVSSKFFLPPQVMGLMIDAPGVIWGRREEMLFAIDRDKRQGYVFLQTFRVEEFRKLVSDMVDMC